MSPSAIASSRMCSTSPPRPKSTRETRPTRRPRSKRPGVLRHYAIPGSERCIQCHMGSPSASFVLGFTPLQVNKVSAGESGVIESSGPDELTQLQRLIDYGVINGLRPRKGRGSARGLAGQRHPRNDQSSSPRATSSATAATATTRTGTRLASIRSSVRCSISCPPRTAASSSFRSRA